MNDQTQIKRCAGLIRCGHCGCAMTSTTSRCKPGTLKRYFYYRCSHKTKGYQGD